MSDFTLKKSGGFIRLAVRKEEPALPNFDAFTLKVPEKCKDPQEEEIRKFLSERKCSYVKEIGKRNNTESIKKPTGNNVKILHNLLINNILPTETLLKNNPEILYMVGWYYSIVKKDKTTAESYYSLATENGGIDGFWYIACMHKNDPEKFVEYLKRAVKNGSINAIKSLIDHYSKKKKTHEALHYAYIGAKKKDYYSIEFLYKYFEEKNMYNEALYYATELSKIKLPLDEKNHKKHNHMNNKINDLSYKLELHEIYLRCLNRNNVTTKELLLINFPKELVNIIMKYYSFIH